MSRLFKWFAGLFGGLFVLMLLAGLASLLSGRSIEDNTVLKVELDGELAESPDRLSALVGGSPRASLIGVVGALRRAANDDRITGVLLVIKAPQLGLAQVQEIEEAMTKVREANKWTLAFLETAGVMMLGDAAFAAATTADRVVLAPPGEINLSGLRASTPFLKGALERLGIESFVEKRHAYKTAANSITHDGFTPEHREALATLLDDLQGQLVDHLTARRKTTADAVRGWFAHGTYGATGAKEHGLVDAVAYWDEAKAEVEKLVQRDEDLFVTPQQLARASAGESGPQMALIVAAGQITQGKSTQSPTGSGTVGSDTITKAFRQARKAEVKGVLLRVASPGGSYVASDLIRREVQLTREAGIPVVISMGNVAASGGYFIAMDADAIVADPGTITGSIGVFMGLLSMRRFFAERLGITFDTYDASPEAAAVGWLDPPNPRARQRIAASLDRIYDDFVSKAAKGRGKTHDEIHEVAQGRVWTGRAAVERGLADMLGGVGLAVEKLKELNGIEADATVSFRSFPPPKTALELIRELLSARTGAPGDVRMLELLGAALGITPRGGALLFPVNVTL